MTATANSTALWADQQPTGAATEYRMWLQSWPGATAAVVVLGVAFQDLAGNPGQQNQQLQVQKRQPFIELLHVDSHIPINSALARSSTACAALTHVLGWLA